MSLRNLRKFDFLKPSVSLWNGMIEEVAKRLPKRVDLRVPENRPFPHPFQVTVERDEQDESEPDGRMRRWRVSVRSGCVNDEAVAIG